MKKLFLVAGTVPFFALGILLAYASWPSNDVLPQGAVADRVLVLKSERALLLLRGGQALKRYSVALGRHPEGAKQVEGDGRTPEGEYVIDYRNPKSGFHLSLHVSYPSPTDSALAAARGAEPGGLIMLHGLHNGFGFIGRLHRLRDWTNGCVALTDSEIEELWRAVPNGTPIEIRP